MKNLGPVVMWFALSGSALAGDSPACVKATKSYNIAYNKCLTKLEECVKACPPDKNGYSDQKCMANNCKGLKSACDDSSKAVGVMTAACNME